jgi:4'-phosphopantetheinyl transferase
VAADPVRVWLIGAPRSARVLARLEGVLDDEERRRADRLLFEHQRRRFVVAHGAARVILGRLLGVPPARLCWERGAHGKPELAMPAATRVGVLPRVSLSHSGELAVLAVSAVRPVGVDIQRLRDDLDAVAMSARYFTGREASFVAAAERPAGQLDRFARLWARKEACVKATGGRLMQGMALPVHPAVRGPGRARGVLVSGTADGLPGPYLVRDIPAPQGFRAAVALEGGGAYRVIARRWRRWG